MKTVKFLGVSVLHARATRFTVSFQVGRIGLLWQRLVWMACAFARHPNRIDFLRSFRSKQIVPSRRHFFQSSPLLRFPPPLSRAAIRYSIIYLPALVMIHIARQYDTSYVQYDWTTSRPLDLQSHCIRRGHVRFVRDIPEVRGAFAFRYWGKIEKKKGGKEKITLWKILFARDDWINRACTNDDKLKVEPKNRSKLIDRRRSERQWMTV